MHIRPGGRSFSTLTVALTSAALALLAPRADAQTPRISPDARGFQTTMILQQQARARQQARTQVAAPARPTTPSYQPQPTGVGVSVNVPTPVAQVTTAPSGSVSIRGPDGEVRRFPLASGVEVQYRRQYIVLRPGESTTIRIIPR